MKLEEWSMSMKVGDKIKVKDGTISRYIGKVGRIIEIENIMKYPIKVEFRDMNTEGNKGVFNRNEVELI